MKRLWFLRILGFFFLSSASYVIYYNFTHSGRAPFFRDLKAKLTNIYNVPGKWTTEDGRQIELKDLKGKTSVLSFVFLDCKMSCPRIMADLKALDDAQRKLAKTSKLQAPDTQGNIKNLPINFQIFLFEAPEKSSIGIKEFRRRYGITGRKNWNILYAKEAVLHQLTDVFSLNYADAPNGSRKYKHTNFYALINREGKVLALKYGYLGHPKEILNIVKKIIITKEQK